MTWRPPPIEYSLLCWERLQLKFWNLCWCFRESRWKRSSVQSGIPSMLLQVAPDAVIAKPCSLSGLTRRRVTRLFDAPCCGSQTSMSTSRNLGSFHAVVPPSSVELSFSHSTGRWAQKYVFSAKKLHITLAASHWPELSHMATPSCEAQKAAKMGLI